MENTTKEMTMPRMVGNEGHEEGHERDDSAGDGETAAIMTMVVQRG